MYLRIRNRFSRSNSIVSQEKKRTHDTFTIEFNNTFRIQFRNGVWQEFNKQYGNVIGVAPRCIDAQEYLKAL
jgi:hypothetical protein